MYLPILAATKYEWKTWYKFVNHSEYAKDLNRTFVKAGRIFHYKRDKFSANNAHSW